MEQLQWVLRSVWAKKGRGKQNEGTFEFISPLEKRKRFLRGLHSKKCLCDFICLFSPATGRAKGAKKQLHWG